MYSWTYFPLISLASGDNSAHVWRIPKPEEKDKKDKQQLQQQDSTALNKVKSWAPILEPGI